MNPNLHLNKLITISLIVIFASIYSCNPFAPPPPHPEKIKIMGIEPNGDLDLKDKDNNSAKTFPVKAGKTINWLLNTHDVASIDSIYKKPASINVFITGPARIQQSQDWTGTVDPNAHVNTEEGYNIDWTDKVGGKHTFDPVIQVR